MMSPNTRRRLARTLGVIVLLAGLVGLFVRHAPPTVWAVPVRAGDVLEGWRVDDVRRSVFEVRVELSRGDDHRAALWVDASNPTWPILGRSGRTTLLDASGGGAQLPAPVADALLRSVADWQATWPAPPAFVAPRTVDVPVRAQVETVLAELWIVVWIAALVACAPQLAAWSAGVGAGAWGALLVLVVAQAAFVHLLGIGGAWHSNQHGYDRLADVEQGTPPAIAALGLLHGHGYYALLQPLFSLSGGRVGVFAWTQVVNAAGLVALFGWLSALWGRTRPALFGVAFAAALPIGLRLSASEDMYVPAVAWVCATLLFVELWQRTGSTLALALAVPPALLAMQTRAELLVLMPAWVLLGVAMRRPDRLRGAVRSAPVGALVGVALLALVPRGLSLLASPPPEDLRRASVDLLGDPRLVVLIGVAVGLVGLLPVVRAPVLRLSLARRRTLLAAVGLAAIGAIGAYVVAVGGRGGPVQRTWQVHALFDPAWVAPWVALLAVAGLAVAAASAPRRAVVLGLSVVGALWLYLPQYDCPSTFVRTGLATVPFLAASGGLALDAVAARLGRWPGGLVAAGLLVSGVVWELPWMTTRDAKAAYWDLVEGVRERVGPDDVVVWLADADAPAGALPAGVHLERVRLDKHLGPERRVLSIGAWRAGEAAGAARVWFARTPDCVRVLLSDRGHQALAGDRPVTWRYLDVSRLALSARIGVDGVDPAWIDPSCSLALSEAGPAVWSVVPDARNTGSVFETAIGADLTIGLYPLTPRPAPATPRDEAAP